MERSNTQPVYISDVEVTESLGERCTFEDSWEDWQDLEHFWGEEKHRLQDVDGLAKTLSSSLEGHLLNDNFLNEPESFSQSDESHELQIVKGEDIPTSYTIRGFRPQELVVIGTYIDKDITPGFRYKVRKNLTEEYLFDGEAKCLVSVGLGYGKRLTFESDTLNENQNYFWSDSRDHGYGFSLQTINKGDVFSILNTKTGKYLGRVSINNRALEEDIVLATMVGERGFVEKEVEVQFNCDVVLNDGVSNVFIEDVTAKGKVAIVRESMTSMAKIDQIFLDDFVVEGCLLLPEE